MLMSDSKLLRRFPRGYEACNSGRIVNSCVQLVCGDNMSSESSETAPDQPTTAAAADSVAIKRVLPPFPEDDITQE